MNDAMANLNDARLHHLRQSFASVAVSGGASLLPIIGALFGPTDSPTTQRYARLADDPLKSVTEAVRQKIEGAFRSEPSAKVDTLRYCLLP